MYAKVNKFIFSPLITSNASQLIRNYAFKSDLKIKWIRPEKIPCIKPEKSGDRSPFPDIDKNQYMLKYQNCKELETADETVKRLFSLGGNRENETKDFYAKILMDKVKRHDLDCGSMEVRLASQTATIRKLQVHMEKYPKNQRAKVCLKELIDKRKKFLTKLRRWDYRRFEWVLEKLDLVYKAYPSYYHWITRRESLTKLTDIHCKKIRNERLAAYRTHLKSQQIGFLEKKLQNLEFIRKEQIECAVPVTVSIEDIKEVQVKLKSLMEKAARKTLVKQN
ncbi:28S ribosomal protein S15, mitochondrial [Pseudolycoriella hygida]|uniref:Small ribosomal subunit protein uS15m n=1 Tax=Pseudolycoriella hygida TaxID=35572 RepID=A0A9Q0N4A1_9DIPT|nr:28S ribosomal protein S15, mitochondrial [Pseudolycoriella hygida]